MAFVAAIGVITRFAVLEWPSVLTRPFSILNGYYATERPVKLYFQDFCKMAKVLIHGEDRQMMPSTCSTNQKVRIRALYAVRPASIEAVSSILVIRDVHYEIGKCPQAFTQRAKMRCVPNT